MSEQDNMYDHLATLIQNLLAKSGMRFRTEDLARRFGVSEATTWSCLDQMARSGHFLLQEEGSEWVFGLKLQASSLNARNSHRARMQQTRAVKIFYCYAHKDKGLRDKLAAHLSPLRREGQISEWSDYNILPGMDWSQAIGEHLHTANIILLLLSSNFLQSDHCYSEMMRALERYREGKVHVIPIILSPVSWKKTPVRDLQVLPTGAIPVTNWRNREEAFQDIAEGVATVAQVLLTKLSVLCQD